MSSKPIRTQRRLELDEATVQHMNELWATKVGVFMVYNLTLTSALFAFIDIPLTFVLTIALIGLLFSIFIRKLVFKTPEELVEQEDKK